MYSEEKDRKLNSKSAIIIMVFACSIIYIYIFMCLHYMNTCCHVYMYVFNVHMNTYICVHYKKNTQTRNMSIYYIYKHISIEILSGWVLLYFWRELPV